MQLSAVAIALVGSKGMLKSVSFFFTIKRHVTPSRTGVTSFVKQFGLKTKCFIV